MTIAKVRPEFVSVVVEMMPPHEPFVPSSSSSFVVCLTVDCADYDAFKALPKCLEYQLELCTLTGWNSDRGRAYYKSGLPLARLPGGT